jgi:dUTP pyrophosphatase
MVLQIEKLHPSAVVPSFAYTGDAGADLFSIEDIAIAPGQVIAVGTGLRMAIPIGYAGFVWDKSGLALKSSITTMAGVIDSNYRGEIKVVLTNLGKEPFSITKGSKIAQIIINKVEAPEIQEGPVSTDTERGEKGFGSSGAH